MASSNENQYKHISSIEYNKFIKSAVSYIYYIQNQNKIVNIVGIYRGSLGMSAHISNITNTKMSILKFQKYDGNDKEVTSIYEDINDGETILIFDDIYDTGETMELCKEYLTTKFPNSNVMSITIIGKVNDSKINSSFIDHDGESWYIFPWERIDE